MKRTFTSLMFAVASLAYVYAQPGAPTLLSPSNGAQGVATTLSLSWSSVSGANSYTMIYSTASDLSSVTGSVTTSSTSYSFGSGALDTSTVYYWTVYATDNVGSGSTADTFMFKTVGSAPMAPVLKQPLNNAINVAFRPTLIWSLIGNANSYEVQVSTDTSFAAVTHFTTVSAPDTFIQLPNNLAHSTKYYWRVRAVNLGGNSAWSTRLAFTTRPEPPAKPVLISPSDGAIGVKINETVLQWDSTRNVENFRIIIANNASLTSKVLDTIVNSSNTSLLAGKGKLIPLSTYYWTVISIDNKNFTNEGDIWSFTTNIAPPAKPVLSSPSSASINTSVTPTLTWKSASGAVTYGVQVAYHTNFGDTVFFGNTTAPDTNIVVTPKLADNRVHYWRVRAENAGGYSEWSNYWNFTTLITNIKGYERGNYSLEVSPNPAAIESRVTFELTEEGKMTLLVTDMSGRTLLTLADGTYDSGKQSYILNTSGLEAGIYLVTLRSGNAVQSVRLLVY